MIVIDDKTLAKGKVRTHIVQATDARAIGFKPSNRELLLRGKAQ